ncbi:MAG: GAF domain-containing protein [bacterium]|nr:GAF domain-containing protein [bacterium]
MSELTSNNNLEDLLNKVIDYAMELTKAERGFLVLLNESFEKQLMVARGVDRKQIENAMDATSSTVIKKLFELRRPLLVESVSTHDSLARQQSIVKQGICSIIGAPLIIRNRVIGVTYVDTTNPAKAFSPREQDLFTALGSIAAIAIETAGLISSLESASKTLQDTSDFLGNLLRSLPDGVVVFASDRKIHFSNSLVRKRFSSTNSNVPQTCSDIPFFATDAGKKLLAAATEGDWTSQSIEGTDVIGGTRVHYHVFDVPRRGEEQLYGLLLADRTKEYQLEQEVIRTSKFSLVSQLAGGIAHEINNALTPAFSALQLAQIRARPNPIVEVQSLRESIDVAFQQLNKTSQIVKDLRNLSRPKQPKFERVDVTALVHSTVKLLRSSSGRLKFFDPSNPTAKFRLMVEVPNDTLFVLGDVSQIEGMMFNLILNAAQAVEEKGSGAITVKLILDGDRIKFVVADEGVGIAADKLAQIFEPYYSTKPDDIGTGLGLTIVEMAATAHHATVSVESKIDVGTVFTISFPVFSEI